MNITASFPSTNFTFHGNLCQLWDHPLPFMHLIIQETVERMLNHQGYYKFICDITGTMINITLLSDDPNFQRKYEGQDIEWLSSIEHH